MVHFGRFGRIYGVMIHWEEKEMEEFDGGSLRSEYARGKVPVVHLGCRERKDAIDPELESSLEALIGLIEWSPG